MSFEGYNQHICLAGHYFEADVYDHDLDCPRCEAPPAWTNLVDETNCIEEGAIPIQVLREHFQIVDHTFVKNPLTGTVSEVEVFRIPSPKETGLLRHCRHDDEYVPISALNDTR